MMAFRFEAECNLNHAKYPDERIQFVVFAIDKTVANGLAQFWLESDRFVCCPSLKVVRLRFPDFQPSLAC